MQARTENNWVRCGKCGHKFFRVMEGGGYPLTLEIKCSSCKALNIWDTGAERKIKKSIDI